MSDAAGSCMRVIYFSGQLKCQMEQETCCGSISLQADIVWMSDGITSWREFLMFVEEAFPSAGIWYLGPMAFTGWPISQNDSAGKSASTQIVMAKGLLMRLIKNYWGLHIREMKDIFGAKMSLLMPWLYRSAKFNFVENPRMNGWLHSSDYMVILYFF